MCDEWMKQLFHANDNQKKAGVTIPILHQMDFKSKTVSRGKEGHYIMIDKRISSTG